MIITSVCIGNLKRYNEGNLTSDWITLPMSKENLCKRIKMLSDSDDDEIIIMDHGHEVTDNSYHDIYSLNDCLNTIEEDSYGRSKECLLALIEYCKQYDDIPISDIWEIFKDGDYQTLDNVKNETDLAIAHMELYASDLYSMLNGYSFESCFNYTQMGKELIRDSGWVLIPELRIAIRRDI